MAKRRTVINNTGIEVREDLMKALYKVMDRRKATESCINFVHENYLEVDMFNAAGECVGWAVPVYSKKEKIDD